MRKFTLFCYFQRQVLSHKKQESPLCLDTHLKQGLEGIPAHVLGSLRAMGLHRNAGGL